MSARFDEIVQKLKSRDILINLSGIDDARVAIEELARVSVALLFECPSDWCYAVAERVFALGPAAIPELERHLGTTGEGEVPKVHAALILLKLGSRAGIAQLLRALREGFGPIGTIAGTLAHFGIFEAGEAISNLLIKWPVREDPHTAATLILALRSLDVKPPADVLRELEQTAPHVRKLV